jgi:predicted DNA-binding transcriptional regulator AlpA
MFDGDSFLQNPEWLADVADYVAPAPAETVRENVIGLEECAIELGLSIAQIRAMLRRDAFPSPDLSINRAPAWWAGTIDEWCNDTGHGHPLGLAIQ